MDCLAVMFVRNILKAKMMSIVPRYSCSIEIIIENVPYSSIFYNFYQDIHVPCICLSYFLGGKSPRLISGFGSRVAQSNTNHRSVEGSSFFAENHRNDGASRSRL